MTATVTATAAANGYQQQPATAHNASTIRDNLGYVRPEKRKLGGGMCSKPVQQPQHLQTPIGTARRPTTCTSDH
jgi:hypothetical protein